MSDNVGAAKRKANLKMKMLKKEEQNRVPLLCPADSEPFRGVYPSTADQEAAGALVQQQQAIGQVQEIDLNFDPQVGIQQKQQALVSPPEQALGPPPKQGAVFPSSGHSRTPRDGHRFVMHVALCPPCRACHLNAYDDAMLAATPQ